MRYRLVAALLTIMSVAFSSSPTRADVTFPLVAQYTALHDLPISAAAIKKMDDDFMSHRDTVTKRLSPAIAKTDQGYGARYRVRYQFRDGFVDLYSGVFDGARRDIHLTPRTFADALKLGRTLSTPALAIDFSKPAEHDRNSVTYQSKGDGCSAGMTFVRDASGRVMEIDSGTAC